MFLPFPEPPPPPPKPPRRGSVGTPNYFAFWVGFNQGADGQGASFRYDADDEIDQFYKDGHTVGRLFRPLPCMKEQS